MELRQIYMNRYSAGDHFTGSITFSTPQGEIKLNMAPGLSDKIIAAVAEELKETAQQAAQAMTADIFTQASELNALEDKHAILF